MKYLTILALVYTSILYGQKKITASSDLFVSLNFPTNVETAKISIPDLIDVQTSEDNVYLQYLTSDSTETSKTGNMLVKTVDGYYYSFLINYSEKPEPLNYFIEVKEALKRVTPKEIPTSQGGTKKATPTLMSTDSELIKNAKDIVINGGYIKARNIIFQKKMELIHRGIYAEDKKLYFLFFINNKSSIPFNVESYKFEIVSTNDNEAGVSQTVLPIEIYNKENIFSPNTENKMVFIFDQFTISDGKKLVLTINEKKGDRSLIYDIDPKILSSARPIKK